MIDLTQLPSGARTPQSVATYQADLRRFLAWAGPERAGTLLDDQVATTDLLRAYQVDLLAAELSSASVNRRVDCLRGLLRAARESGRIGWRVELRSLPRTAYTDTRGPGPAGAAALLRGLGSSAIDCRDRVALRLSWDLALRRGEVVALDLVDLVEPDRLRVAGKGGTLAILTLPGQTQAALALWLRHRTSCAGPLVCACRADYGVAFPLRRLAAGQWWRRLRQLSDAAGIPPVRPHGLRHGAITAALDAGVDLRDARHFSRHKKLETLGIYDDNRRDLGGAVAAIVSALPLLARETP